MRWATNLPTRNRVGTTAATMPIDAAATVTIITMIIAVASAAASFAATAAFFAGLENWSGLFSLSQDTATMTTTATPTEASAGSAFSRSYSSSSSFSVSAELGSGCGSGGGINNREPPCEMSDDPDYSCLVSRPPGAFDDEFRIYLSSSRSGQEADEESGQQLLNVKVVVPGVIKGGGGGRGRNGVWASLGFSPNGRMAGPSEAVVGVVGAAENGQGKFL